MAAGGDGLSVHSSLQTRCRSHGVRGPAAPHQTILANRTGGVGQAINVAGPPFGTARVGSDILRLSIGVEKKVGSSANLMVPRLVMRHEADGREADRAWRARKPDV